MNSLVLRSRSRAFTLIELLVVIAIIAILAAILFPVFAQAKAAAKRIASVSNDKQIDLALIMYSNDYDDRSPIDCIWNSSDAVYWFGTPGSQWSPWTYEVLPYIKTSAIFQDSQIQAEPVDPTVGTTADQQWAYWPEYGLNYTALSPITDASNPSNWIRTPTSFSSLSRPSETVAVTAHERSEETIGWYWWGAGTLLISPYTIEAPNCYTIQPLCMDNWGHGWYADTWLKGNVTAGSMSGFSSVRVANQSVTSFCDGHVKTLPPGALAAGTNWNPNIQDYQLVVTNPGSYLWGNVN